MKITKHCSCLIFSVSLIVVIFCVSVILPVFSASFYINEFRKYDLAGAFKMTEPDLRLVVKNLLGFMAGFTPRLDIRVPVFGAERLFFNSREIFHMEDVRVLFTRGFTAMWAAAALLAGAGVYIFQKKYFYDAAKWVLGTCVFLICSFGTLAAVIAFNFERAFVIFHEVFFTNDMWLLNPDTDLLINMLPQEFFISISGRIAAYFFGGIIIILGLSIFASAKFKRKGPTP